MIGSAYEALDELCSPEGAAAFRELVDSLPAWRPVGLPAIDVGELLAIDLELPELNTALCELYKAIPGLDALMAELPTFDLSELKELEL